MLFANAETRGYHITYVEYMRDPLGIAYTIYARVQWVLHFCSSMPGSKWYDNETILLYT